MVVYKFICANCNVCYVDETSRHLATRIKEHLRKDKTSHIFKHLEENDDCRVACTDGCFSILDRAGTTYGFKLKEAIHISLLKPGLNKQVYNYGVNLTI